MRQRWVLPLLLFAAAMLISLFFLITQRTQMLVIRIDLATLTVLAGTGLALLGTAYGIIQWRSEMRVKHLLVEVRQQTGDEHHRFVRRLDHELKNPLTAIQAGLVNLGQHIDIGLYREPLSELDGQVLRLNRLLRDLRKLAEFETCPIERMQIDVTDLLSEVLSLAEERPEAIARDIRLSVPPTPRHLPLIHGDWDMLFLAIHNLVDNAIKYTLPGNSIEIRAFRDAFSLVIQVADTGPGISEDELLHIWEELARGYSARSVVGSGLGLSLVKIIIERHRGNVSLQSRVGHGTVFTIRLPISSR